MKRIILFALFAISFGTHAQLVRPFMGVSLYLQWDFEKSKYAGVNAGTEFKVTSYFMPELECSYYFGSIEDASKYKIDTNFTQTEWYVRSVSSLNFSFCPKICLGNKNDGTNYLVILPRYTLSRINANGSFSNYNESNNIVVADEFQTDIQHSLGLGVGINVFLSNETSSSLCLILYYNGVNMGKVINELDHSSGYEFNSNGVLGAGLNYYFGKRTIKKPKPIKQPEPL